MQELYYIILPASLVISFGVDDQLFYICSSWLILP